ncbi:hypothetical protein CYMTET_24315 [Cymbomonas tetramitiformis]|uniref:UBA domain-containing protein n=1 Tax=Cymbomonas tetramitiformis TaxID=36881 RepID=A0AAE0FXG7_9CHLO|nr:hypothetical protein CYMTET_24315 [Cymbomonas tetramitiformis]
MASVDMKDLHDTEGKKCDWCGGECDGSVQELNALHCTFEDCPAEAAVYHQECLERYLKGLRLEKSRKTGFKCPRGCGKASKYEKPCCGKIDKSHPIHARNENSKRRRKGQLPATPQPPPKPPVKPPEKPAKESIKEDKPKVPVLSSSQAANNAASGESSSKAKNKESSMGMTREQIAAAAAKARQELRLGSGRAPPPQPPPPKAEAQTYAPHFESYARPQNTFDLFDAIATPQRLNNAWSKPQSEPPKPAPVTDAWSRPSQNPLALAAQVNPPTPQIHTQTQRTNPAVPANPSQPPGVHSYKPNAPPTAPPPQPYTQVNPYSQAVALQQQQAFSSQNLYAQTLGASAFPPAANFRPPMQPGQSAWQTVGARNSVKENVPGGPPSVGGMPPGPLGEDEANMKEKSKAQRKNEKRAAKKAERKAVEHFVGPSPSSSQPSLSENESPPGSSIGAEAGGRWDDCVGVILKHKKEFYVQQLVQLGFEEDQCSLAVHLHGSNLELCVAWLLESSGAHNPGQQEADSVSLDISAELAQIEDWCKEIPREEVEEAVIACQGKLEQAFWQFEQRLAAGPVDPPSTGRSRGPSEDRSMPPQHAVPPGYPSSRPPAASPHGSLHPPAAAIPDPGRPSTSMQYDMPQTPSAQPSRPLYTSTAGTQRPPSAGSRAYREDPKAWDYSPHPDEAGGRPGPPAREEAYGEAPLRPTSDANAASTSSRAAGAPGSHLIADFSIHSPLMSAFGKGPAPASVSTGSRIHSPLMSAFGKGPAPASVSTGGPSPLQELQRDASGLGAPGLLHNTGGLDRSSMADPGSSLRRASFEEAPRFLTGSLFHSSTFGVTDPAALGPSTQGAVPEYSHRSLWGSGLGACNGHHEEAGAHASSSSSSSNLSSAPSSSNPLSIFQRAKGSLTPEHKTPILAPTLDAAAAIPTSAIGPLRAPSGPPSSQTHYTSPTPVPLFHNHQSHHMTHTGAPPRLGIASSPFRSTQPTWLHADTVDDPSSSDVPEAALCAAAMVASEPEARPPQLSTPTEEHELDILLASLMCH